MSHVQEDHDEAFLPFVGIIIAELTSATVVCRLPSRRLPRCFPPFGRLPPRSDLATSSWKAQCRLVLAVHEEEGSPVTECGQMWCPARWETTSLLPGMEVEGLRQPTSCPACRLFPSPVQVLPVVVLPSCATLVVCRWDQQRTVDSLPPSPESADTARGTGKERSMGRWRPRASASSLGFQDVIVPGSQEQNLSRDASCCPRRFWT